jgi:hypothetical protein
MKRELTKDLSKEIDRLSSEIKKNELENEIYKKNISEQLKKLDKNSLINTDKKTVNLTLWERIMKVLGMN